MPEMDFLIGQYLTNRPMDYEITQDIFQGILKVQMPEKYVVGEVIDLCRNWLRQDSLIIVRFRMITKKCKILSKFKTALPLQGTQPV